MLDFYYGKSVHALFLFTLNRKLSDNHTSILLRYQSDVIGNGLANQVSNPDVEVDITKPDVVIRTQIAVLKDMTNRLKAAHSGNDVTFELGEGAKPPALSVP